MNIWRWTDHFLGTLTRATWIALRCGAELAVLGFWAISSRVGLRRQPLELVCATRLPCLLERLGGAFPKVGQILSTRRDLLSPSICEGLARLQDDTSPMPYKQVSLAIRTEAIEERIFCLSADPTASATIAQVHRAVRIDDGRVIALKIRRPDVSKALEIDCRIAAIVGHLLALLPHLRGVPIKEAIDEASRVLMGQTNLRQEASNLQRFGQLFAKVPDVLFPKPHIDLSGDGLLVMDFMEDLRKFDDSSLTDEEAKSALTTGVRALFQMIFIDGFLHCDLHPGNMLVDRHGRLVILDAGFVASIDGESRRSFAQFFLAIAMRDGAAAAKIVKQTARKLPSDLDTASFDREISELIVSAGGLTARHFQVAGFVAELFSIQRRHKIHGTSKFTMPILSLLVFEGVAKRRHPDLDFQKLSIPFVLAAMAPAHW